tara:strand:+ start:770 stop:1489 length:720 start_codon:yes stop_codon:yes gene_type:complete
MITKKTLLIAALLITPCVSYAGDTPTPIDLKGVKIVPMKEMAIPADVKSQVMMGVVEENQKGYRENNENYAGYFFNIRKEALKQFSMTQNDKYGVYDTNLKKNYQDIKLSFNFSGIKSIPKKDIIAYAAIGSYKKGKEYKKEGWDSIRVFFAKPYGICSYQFMHIINAMLPAETTEYFVNNKPSFKEIEGNVNDGFVYRVNWYNNDSINILECANKNLDKNIIPQMIEASSAIDEDMFG